MVLELSYSNLKIILILFSCSVKKHWGIGIVGNFKDMPMKTRVEQYMRVRVTALDDHVGYVKFDSKVLPTISAIPACLKP